MEYLLKNLSRTDINKLNNSDIEWYPDDITDNSQEVTICFETEQERTRAMEFLEIKNYTTRVF